MKVLGTNKNLYTDMINALKELGFTGNHNQFRIVCKCKSVADANRKCEAAGLGDKVFRSGWYSETGNKAELAICETTDIAICVDRTMGGEYVTIEQVKEKMEEMK